MAQEENLENLENLTCDADCSCRKPQVTSEAEQLAEFGVDVITYSRKSFSNDPTIPDELPAAQFTSRDRHVSCVERGVTPHRIANRTIASGDNADEEMIDLVDCDIVVNPPRNNPEKSDALGIHASTIPGADEHKVHGVGAYYCDAVSVCKKFPYGQPKIAPEESVAFQHAENCEYRKHVMDRHGEDCCSCNCNAEAGEQ